MNVWATEANTCSDLTTEMTKTNGSRGEKKKEEQEE
jgi:hypothetical protein